MFKERGFWVCRVGYCKLWRFWNIVGTRGVGVFGEERQSDDSSDGSEEEVVSLRCQRSYSLWQSET